MTRKRKVALGATAGIGVLLAAMATVPLLFADRIEARVRSEIDGATRLQITWDDIGLTLFRNFPHPTFTLAGLTAVGTGSFEGDTLAAVRRVQLTLDGTSFVGAIRGTRPLEVRSVRVERPVLQLLVDEDGVANWSLSDPDAAAPEAGDPSELGLALSLRRVEVTEGDVTLNNAASGLFFSARAVRHELSGDFSRASLTAQTVTHADSVSVRFAGVPYLSDATADFDASFDVTPSEGRARLIDNELRLNELLVRWSGEIVRAEDGLDLDLTLEAPSTEFGRLLSLVPVVYAQDFAALETSGSFSLDGFVRGVFAAGVLPSFGLDLTVRDGGFRYPDLPLPARSIRADLAITNPGGDPDSTVVALSDLHVEIDGQPIDGAVTIRTPLSDPDVEARALGTLDLGALARTVKLAAGQELAGVLQADASFRARLSDLDSARYDRVAARGTLSATDLQLRGATLRQPVDIERAELRLTPQAAQLDRLEARLGSSDLRASGRLDNLLGFALGQQTLQGVGRFTSERFVLDEWRSEDRATIPVPGMLDLTIDGTIGDVVFNGMSWTAARGRAVIRDRRVAMEGVQLTALGGTIGMDGYYETLEDQAPAFAMGLVLDSLAIGPSASLTTVRALAPIAPYVQGQYSSVLNLRGTLGPDMAPDLEVLDGDGTVSTSNLAVEGFPVLVRLAETLRLEQLSHPTVRAVRSTLRVRGGRLIVDPFQTEVAGIETTISGSNGIDQSIDYTLGLRIPRSGLTDNVLADLASRMGPLGASLAATDPVRVAVRATGTVSGPALAVSLAETTESARAAAARAAEAAAAQRLDEARQRVDAEREEARARARAQADSIMAEARRQADVIRSEAARAAEVVRTEGNRAADEVLARASNALARAAAQPVADRLRREADERATTIEREADERATALLEEAQARADAIIGGG